MAVEDRKINYKLGCTNWDSFICDSGSCVDETLRCNGHPDCDGGEDELNCEEEEVCLNGQLKCHKNNLCIGFYKLMNCPTFRDI